MDEKVCCVPGRLCCGIIADLCKGAIIPIAAGRMRNEFYPKLLAEYVTKAQLRDLGLEDTVLERDPFFGVALPKAAKEKDSGQIGKSEATTTSVELDMLKVSDPSTMLEFPLDNAYEAQPARAVEVLDILLPSNIDFYRQPITTSTTPIRHSPSVPTTSAISEAAQEGSTSNIPLQTSIYGSVTVADIISNIKALLAEDFEGSRVVLSPEDVSFVEQSEEQDRVKHLGTFEINIQIKGASVVIKRTITVNAQN